MENFSLKSPLKFNVLILRLGGLWSGKKFYIVYSLVSFICIVVTHNLSQVINIYYIYDQLETLTASIVVMLTEVTGMVKFCLFRKNFKIVQELMAKLDSKLFQPKTKQQKKILESFLNGWKRIYVIFSASTALTLILWGLYPIFDKSYKDKNLPFIAWYPYNCRVSPYYEITYVFQIVANYFIAFTNQNVDSFISALLMYIAAETELLCHNLRNLSSAQFIEKNFEDCINHHREILSFAETTNRFISFMTFIQFMTSVISICMTMFQLTLVTPLTPEFYTLVCCQSAVFTQVFVYCWFGNQILIKSNNISHSIYESAWLDSSISFKKNIIFFINKTQQPIKLRAVNFFSLSLETFMTILRTSWSYFALLRQINK